MTSETKRQALREKIEAGRQRLAERDYAKTAKDAADSATNFVKQHPYATLGGAIFVGVAIGAMTKRGRKVGAKVGQRSGVLTRLLADAAIAYGVKMIDQATDAARTGQDRIEDLSDDLTDKARATKRDAAHMVGTASDKAKSTVRRTSRKASRTLRDLRSRTTH